MTGRALLLAAATLLLGAARDPLAGYVAGKPVDCIDNLQDISPAVWDADTIIYRRTGRELWVTGPDGRCPSLRPQTTLIVEVFGGRLCHSDHFRTLAPGEIIPGPICRFRQFVPYTKLPSPRP